MKHLSISVRFFLILLFFVYSGTKVHAQVSIGGTPASFLLKSAAIIPVYTLDSVHVAERIAADKKMGVPNRYGVVEQVNIDIRAEGLKTISGNMLIWRYELECPDAVSLGITFQAYNLPEGARVFIYNPGRSEIFGAFTSLNNKENHQLSLAELKGPRVIIEYDEPNDSQFNGELVIGAVSKAYLDFSSVAAANVLINCPEGTDWQTEKHAVCLMSFHDNSYSYYCSGALINNVRSDQTPYFLTANHCLNTQSLANTLVTYFNYEYPGCNVSSASKQQSLSGSRMVSTNTYSDFCLLKLTESPPSTYKPYFAGWDARPTLIPTSGTCIHHPNGEPKSIAIDNHPFGGNGYRVQWDNNTYSEINTHWEVFYDVGSDASGSSGGPLFDQDHRIIGQLHGGDNVSSLFGKFSLSWNYSLAADKQLKAWLDPDNTNTLQLDGMGYNRPPEAKFVVSVTDACLNTPVSFTDQSKYSPKSWQWTITPSTFEFVNNTSASSQNPVVNFLTEGTYTISLTVKNDFGSDTFIQENLILATSHLPVAFRDVSGELTMCRAALKNYRLVAVGAGNYTFRVTSPENFDMVQKADTLTLSLKSQLPRNGSFDTYVTVTGTHGSCSASDSILMHVILPPNDDVANALMLNSGNSPTFSNDCGTVQPNEPKPAGYSTADNSVWFRFRGPSNGKITIVTQGVETGFAVYEAGSAAAILSGNANNYKQLASGDKQNILPTGSVIQDLPVEPGKNYWLQVVAADKSTGNFSVSLLGNSIEVYPNPSGGVFHLTLSSYRGSQAQLAVYSLSGAQIFTKTVWVSPDSNTVDLDLSAFRSGLYLFRANLDGLIMTKKLMLVK